jgi:hypothetical protein
MTPNRVIPILVLPTYGARPRCCTLGMPPETQRHRVIQPGLRRFVRGEWKFVNSHPHG